MMRLLLIALAVATAAACSAPGSTTGSPAAPTGLAATSLSPEASPVAGLHAPTTFIAHLSGDNEIPPRETRAQGQVILQLSPDGESLSYRLIVTNIDNLIASHIHVGTADENGPVVAFLYGPQPPGGGRHNGVAATGTITGGDLVGPLAGMTLSVLIEAMESGGAYVNAHTNNGVDPPNEGAGDFPGGEIRGQISVAGS